MSKSPVQAALPRERTCQEAGTGGAGLVPDPGALGEAGGRGALWPAREGRGGWRTVLSSCGRWKWLRAFSQSANHKGTLRGEVLVRAWMEP